MTAEYPTPVAHAAAVQRRSAALWLSLLTAVAGAVVWVAIHSGLAIDVRWPAALATGAIFGLLGAGYVRYSRRPADHRLGLALGSLLSIFAAGAAGGIISLLGQTFAFPLIDAPLAAADRAIGLTAVEVVAAVVSWPGLSALLGLAYIATVPLIIVSVIALPFMGRGERVWELCAAFSFCMLVATLCSLFLPAAGAFDYLAMPAELRALLPENSGVYHLDALHELRSATRFDLDFLAVQGVVTFPSFHTAMAAMTAAAWRDDRRLRWPMLIFNAIVIFSTVPIGGHYLVDLPAGLLVWALFFVLGPRWVVRARVSGSLRPAIAA